MKVFIETYGCQMNVYDSGLVMSILKKDGWMQAERLEDADLILINTCSIRENAEQRVFGRLDVCLQQKKQREGLIVAVLGCMAQRMKDKLLEHPAVDLVVGPDSYRRMPALIAGAITGEPVLETTLSHTETYADMEPVRDDNGVTTFVSIMRCCNNMCSYCIVPYVRGPERSRDPESIIRECRNAFEAGYREVTLLGQNVDSYYWTSDEGPDSDMTFARLLEEVAQISPLLRVRFSTSHPKDMSNAVLYSMALYPNICTHIHLPVQSGSDVMLEKMNRKYDRARYMDRIQKIREIVPDCSVTTDVIAGFCSESLEDHNQTLDLLREVRFDSAFMFQYSMRPGTRAHRRFVDDVPEKEKTRRLSEIIDLQTAISLERNREHIGKSFEVLIEGVSKKNKDELFGRTSGNKVCVFPAQGHRKGEYVKVTVDSCTSATLIGHISE